MLHIASSRSFTAPIQPNYGQSEWTGRAVRARQRQKKLSAPQSPRWEAYATAILPPDDRRGNLNVANPGSSYKSSVSRAPFNELPGQLKCVIGRRGKIRAFSASHTCFK